MAEIAQNPAAVVNWRDTRSGAGGGGLAGLSGYQMHNLKVSVDCTAAATAHSNIAKKRVCCVRN